VPPRRQPQVARWALDDAALGKERLDARQIATLPHQRGQQTWLVRRTHAAMILQICVYVVEKSGRSGP
jgi:hypothetical protein